MPFLICMGVIYLFFFIQSFLCPKHPHVLNVYFRVPGSGKTTFAAYLTKWALHENWIIRLCRRFNNPISRLILNSKYLKHHIDVYSNVPITGAYQLDAKQDIGFYMIENAKIIIDEAGIEYNNRNFKSFPAESIYYYKYHRHYKTSVDVFSQSYEDMDITLRRLAQNFYVVRRSLIPGCIVESASMNIPNRSPISNGPAGHGYQAYLCPVPLEAFQLLFPQGTPSEGLACLVTVTQCLEAAVVAWLKIVLRRHFMWCIPT